MRKVRKNVKKTWKNGPKNDPKWPKNTKKR
jgi:hypothetical protein